MFRLSLRKVGKISDGSILSEKASQKLCATRHVILSFLPRAPPPPPPLFFPLSHTLFLLCLPNFTPSPILITYFTIQPSGPGTLLVYDDFHILATFYFSSELCLRNPKLTIRNPTGGLRSAS